MPELETCLFCGVTIRKVQTYEGDVWIHVRPGAHEDNQYQYCRRTVATPMSVQEMTLDA